MEDQQGDSGAHEHTPDGDAANGWPPCGPGASTEGGRGAVEATPEAPERQQDGPADPPKAQPAPGDQPHPEEQPEPGDQPDEGLRLDPASTAELLEAAGQTAPAVLMDFIPERDSPLMGRLLLPDRALTWQERSALLADLGRLIGWADAGQVRTVADAYSDFVRQREPDRTGRIIRVGAAEARSMTVVEAAAALSLTEGQAQRFVARSLRLAGPFAAVLDAQEEGHIGPRHADVIVDQADGIPGDSIEDYAQRCLTSARDRTGRLRASVEVRRSAKGFRERSHPESASVRKQRAVLERRVELRPEQDGMSTLAVLLPDEVCLAAHTRVDQAARALKQTPEETRTLAQLRADVVAGALLGDLPLRGAERPDAVQPGTAEQSAGRPGTAGQSAGRRARRRTASRGRVRADVTLTMPLTTALKVTEHGAELGGLGFVDAATARELAADASRWRIAFTDAEGQVVGMGRKSYRPPAALAAFIRARDLECRWPGCSVPALACEIDHLTEWASGGATNPDNLACLCPRHHRLKTLGLVSAVPETFGRLAPGRIALTTPAGRRLVGLPPLQAAPAVQGRAAVDLGVPPAWADSGFAEADEAWLTDAFWDDDPAWPGPGSWSRPLGEDQFAALVARLGIGSTCGSDAAGTDDTKGHVTSGDMSARAAASAAAPEEPQAQEDSSGRIGQCPPPIGQCPPPIGQCPPPRPPF